MLEIGAGTGYNAALMATIGAEVTTVDVQPDVAERAAAALATTGTVDGVRVVTGDGYLGAPAGAVRPGDRHGRGRRPVTALARPARARRHRRSPRCDTPATTRSCGVRAARGRDRRRRPVTAAAVCGAGFMAASGPLSAGYPCAHPEPWRPPTAPAPAVTVPARWNPSLGDTRYVDLWFAIGVWDRRATFGSFAHGDGVLRHEDGVSGATICPDGAIRAAGPHAAALASDAVALLDRWTVQGAPALPRWRATMALAGDPAQPILVPRTWELEQALQP